MRKIVALIGVGVCLASSIGVSAASSGSVYISSTYGSLYGETYGGKDSTDKWFGTVAETTKSVSKLRAQIQVQYSSTGTTITSATSGWVSSSDYATTWDVEMHHFYNSQTGAYDNFASTKCTSYGTSDAITSTPYVVYTNYSL